MASKAGSLSSQQQSKFGKNLFKSRIADSGAQLETPPPSSLSPGDYDYNPFYIGNQGTSAKPKEVRPPSPIVCDDFNPFYSPPEAAKPAEDKKASTKRNMINEMLQELQRMSTASSAKSVTAGASFGTGGAKVSEPLPDYSTFSVKVGDGIACGSDEPMDSAFGSASCGGGGCSGDAGSYPESAPDNNSDNGYATFSVKVGGDDRDDDDGRHAVSGTSCGSDEPMSKFVSTSAACGTDDDFGADGAADDGGGFGSQASEAAIRIETKLLRFLNDPALTEFRFEGRMQPADRRAVRWFAKERGLFFKEMALRTHERAYVVKKPYALAKEQQAKHREAQRAEARRLLQEASQKQQQQQQASISESSNVGSSSASVGTGGGGGGSSDDVGAGGTSGVCIGSASFGIKVGEGNSAASGSGLATSTIACSDACMETETESADPPGSTAPRRDNWCQTIPDDNFLCYVCQEEVPLIIKAVHIATCLANQRQQLRQDRAEADRELEQLARRQAELRRHKRPGDRRKVAIRQAIEADKKRLADRLAEMGERHAMLHGSGLQQQKQPQQRVEKVRPFESVHSNDIERLVAEARQLDRLCCVKGCGTRLATSDANGAACDACGGRYCPAHAEGPAHGCAKIRPGVGGGVGGSSSSSSSAPTKFERNKLRQGLRDRLAVMAERRK